MPTVHMLYGFLGAGKSTFARQLEESTKAVRLTPDEWMVTLYGRNPPAEFFSEYWTRVNTLITAQLTRLISIGVDVILDEGFWHRSWRDERRALITSLGAKYILYHINCEESLMRERCRKRNTDGADSFIIEDATFDTLLKRIEPLGADEEHQLVWTGSAAQR